MFLHAQIGFLDHVGILDFLAGAAHDDAAGLHDNGVVANIKDWQSWDPLSTKNAGGLRGLVGSGPFMLKSYKPGEYVMMKRNPYYRLLGGGAR